MPYYGKDNDDYVNGGGFCCDDNPRFKSFDLGKNDNPELYQYYYHSDHLGSSSLITNLDGEIVQHIEYVSFGEVFIEERNNKCNTPYLFNAKELDEETGLYYYGARYYDPRTSVWLSVDPLTEKYPNKTPYHYCSNNPVTRIDPNGKTDYIVNAKGYISEKNPKGIFGKIVGLFSKSDNDGIAIDRLYSSDGKNYIVIVGGLPTMNQGTLKNEKGKNVIAHFFRIDGNDQAEMIFEFLAKNSSVEWSRTSYSKEYLNTDKTNKIRVGANIIATSHEEGTERVSVNIVDKYLSEGWTVIHDHSHPKTYNAYGKLVSPMYPSGYKKQGDKDIKGDKPFHEDFYKRYPNADFTTRVFDTSNEKYYYYDYMIREQSK